MKQEQQVKAQSLHVPTKPAPKGRGFMPAFLGGCIVLMTIATIGLVAAKNSDQKIAQAGPIRQPIIMQQPSVDTSRFLTNEEAGRFLTSTDGEKMVSGVQERLDKLEARVDTWSHRTWLLGIAVNENANLAKKYHNAGYITFDGDWKLSSMPTTMNLSEDTKAKLREADVALQAATGVKTECTSHHYVMEPDNMHYHCTNCGARYVRTRTGIFSRCR